MRNAFQEDTYSTYRQSLMSLPRGKKESHSFEFKDFIKQIEGQHPLIHSFPARGDFSYNNDEGGFCR